MEFDKDAFKTMYAESADIKEELPHLESLCDLYEILAEQDSGWLHHLKVGTDMRV